MRPLRARTDLARVVLTGFGAFPGMPRNATAEIVESIARTHGIALDKKLRAKHHGGRGEIALGARRVFASLLVLPVAWEAAEIAIAEARAVRASLVLMSGVAAPVQAILVERGSTDARKALVDAFGAKPARVRAMRSARSVTIDVDVAKCAAERALASEIETAPTLARVATGVACADVRADNAYVCNATTNAVARARLRGARHGFVHWPSEIAPRDVPACARVLLAMADALTSPRAAAVD